MTELAKKINKDSQTYRAIYNYLSETESFIDFKKLSDKEIMYETFCFPSEIYDLIISVCHELKNNPRGLTGKQTEFNDPDITLPSNN